MHVRVDRFPFNPLCLFLVRRATSFHLMVPVKTCSGRVVSVEGTCPNVFGSGLFGSCGSFVGFFVVPSFSRAHRVAMCKGTCPKAFESGHFV